MPPPLKQQMLASSSRSPYLDSALADIKTDAPRIIGIWGMGGVGKTHLLGQINNELFRDGEFSVVIFVTCSKNCHAEKVQNQIINKLDMNSSVSTESKQGIIYNSLKQLNFVILLDDLWSPLDLKGIGIPGPTDMIGTCKGKVILTTRSTEVCEIMGAKKKIRVDVLKWDDAWSLFKKNVTDETIDSHSHIQEFAVKVAKELGGLPLALTTVGRAMHDCFDPNEWELAIERLKQACLPEVKFLDNDESVFRILGFSFENLRNKTLKECFLHCSLWPEDYLINKDELIELWMGLGLLDEFMENDEVEPLIQQKNSKKMKAYKVGYKCIRRLQSVCLLETLEGDLAVKMHDVIRDMALWVANDHGLERNKWVSYADTSKNLIGVNISSETEKLSIMHKHFHRSASISCTTPPKLSTLLLNSCHFFELQWVEQFLGLTYLDLSGNGLDYFPVVICKLVHLQFLNLSRNKIKSLPEELAALTSLRYLLIRNNEICNMSDKILSNLKALRVLDLFENSLNEHVDFALSLLEKTKILADFQALGINIIGMKQFHLLDEFNLPIRWLQVTIYSTKPSVTFLLGNSHMQNLVSLKVTAVAGIQYVMFERTDRSSSHFKRLEQLEFLMSPCNNEVKEIRWNNLNPCILLKKLRILKFSWCISMTSISWIVYLPCLQELKVEYCQSLKQLIDDKYMVNDGKESSNCTFPSLKKLHLSKLPKIESICDPKTTFPALETMILFRCDRLRELPFSANTIPPKLREIKGEKYWSDNFKWADSNLKSSLQPFLKLY